MSQANTRRTSPNRPAIAGLRAVWRSAVWFNWFWPHSLEKEADGCWRMHGPRGRRRLRWKATWALSRVLGMLPRELGPGRWHHACRCGPPLILWWSRGLLPAAIAALVPTRPVRLSGELAFRWRRLLLAWKRRIPAGAFSAMFMGVTAVASPNLTQQGAGELFTPQLMAVSGPAQSGGGGGDAGAAQAVETSSEFATADGGTYDLSGLQPSGAITFVDPQSDTAPPTPSQGPLPPPEFLARNDTPSPFGSNLFVAPAPDPGTGETMTPPPEMPTGPNAEGGTGMGMGMGSGGTGGMGGMMGGMGGMMSMTGGGSGNGGSGSGSSSGNGTGGPSDDEPGGDTPPPSSDPTPSDPPTSDPPPPAGPPVIVIPPPPEPDDPFVPDEPTGGPAFDPPFDPTGGPRDDGFPRPPTELTPAGPDDPGDHPPGDGRPPVPGPGSSLAAVPEPATWATLIFGFGLLGATLRRRRTQRA